MAQPSYSIDDIVYLKASAKVGFLEAYKITALHQVTAGKWIYQIDIAQRMPQPTTVTDRYDLRGRRIGLYFEESALMLFCDALDVVIANLQSRLDRMLAKRTEMCEEGSE